MHKYLSHFYVQAPTEMLEDRKGDANFVIVFSINIFIALHKLIKTLALFGCVCLMRSPARVFHFFHFVATRALFKLSAWKFILYLIRPLDWF